MIRNILKPVFVLVLILILVSVSWIVGYYEGENHVIRDAVFFIVDIPEVGDNFLPVYMELDESVYDYEAFIG